MVITVEPVSRFCRPLLCGSLGLWVEAGRVPYDAGLGLNNLVLLEQAAATAACKLCSSCPWPAPSLGSTRPPHHSKMLCKAKRAL
jgi:hypothetical protein